MLHSATSQFLLKTRPACSDDDARSPDRQRGMWSFLTWSFFLAQAVAAHEAYAKGVAHGDGDADGGAGSGSDNDGSAKGLAPAQPLGVSGFDLDAAAAAKLAAAMAAGMLSADALKAMQADPSAFQAFVDALSGGGSIGAAAGASASSGDVVVEPGQDGPGNDPGSLPDLPGIVLPIDVAIDLGLELGGNPLLDVGLGLDNGLGIHIALNSTPVIDLGASLDGGLDVQLGLLGMTVGLGTDGGLGGLLSLGGGLDGVSLTSALGLVHSATGLPADGFDPILAPVNSVVGGLGDVTTTATSMVRDLSDSPVVGSVLASGGTIFHALDGLQPVADFFGASGQHTAYAIELQSMAGGSVDGSATIAMGTNDDMGAVIDHIDDAATTLSSVVESLHLRGVGDGYA